MIQRLLDIRAQHDREVGTAAEDTSEHQDRGHLPGLLDAVSVELAGMRGRAEWFLGSGIANSTSTAMELDHWQRRIRAATGYTD